MKIILYHYSAVDFINKIKPSFFGKNYFTNNSKTLSNVKRSFFYIDNSKESFFNGVKYCYNASIDEKKLYDFRIDKKKYFLKHSSIDGVLKAVKKAGYIGIIGHNGYDIVNLFYDIKIDKKEVTLC